MRIRRIDHVGVIVRDFDAAKAFFLDFGLESLGEGEMEGGLLERVVGLDGARTRVAMLRTPDGQATIELIRFSSPPYEGDIQHLPPHAPGIRHIAFVVEEIDAVIAKLRKNGVETFSEIQQYEDTYKLCYVHGPEGIIIELAEELA